MKPALLDTNVVSILFRPHHALFTACVEEVSDYHWCLSFMTRSELLLWPRANGWGPRRVVELVAHIADFTTLLPDEQTCEIWADVAAESRFLGRPITVDDAWIAATAIQWDLPLFTNNFKDFEHLKRLTVKRIR
jgi:tRNA(fMet)-specific endonuclease VapC